MGPCYLLHFSCSLRAGLHYSGEGLQSVKNGLAKTWLYVANGGCAGEELKAIKYFLLSWASPAS